MYVIAADDEPLILNSMTRLLHAVFPDAQVRGFGTAQEVESFAREAVASCANIAYAFLDLRLRGENGLRLAKAIKDISPHTDQRYQSAYENRVFNGLCRLFLRIAGRWQHRIRHETRHGGRYS